MSETDDLAAQIGDDRSLLLLDDDEPFLRRLARAMEKRGFIVEIAQTVAEAKQQVAAMPPAYGVFDLRLQDGNGLDVVEALRAVRPDARIVVLTGYGAIASAVARPIPWPAAVTRQVFPFNLGINAPKPANRPGRWVQNFYR